MKREPTQPRAPASATGLRVSVPVLGGLASLAVAALVGAVWFALLPSAPTFDVAPGQRGAVGTWVAAKQAPAQMLFSEGTSIQLEDGTRARVTALERKRAELVLEHGHLTASVTHRPGFQWQLSAGPVHVLVTGTRFTMDWQPERDEFVLDLLEGSVTVTEDGTPRSEQLTRGYRLRMNVSAHSAEVQPLFVADTEVRPEVVKPPAPPPPQPVDAGVPTPPPPPPPPVARLTWQQAAAARRYEEALALARRAGFAAQCQKLPAQQLLLLADVSRFARRPDLAAEALEATRTRFPSSSAAATAAFSLGRLRFDEGRDDSQAVRWFRTYLKEAPHGPRVQEAMGRLVETLHRAGSTAEAERAAKAYLRRFRTGAHAALARRIAGSSR